MMSSSPKSESVTNWLLLILVGLAPGLLLDPMRIVRFVTPLKGDSLQFPSSIVLGPLKPRERQTINVQIRNVSGRRIDLRPVESDCGCLVVNNAPTVLSAGQSSEVKISIEAPSVPGEFFRSLLIRPVDEELAWRMVLKGNVAAPLWSEPAFFEVDFDDQMTAEGWLKIRHVDGFRLGQVLPSSPSVEVVELQDVENGIELRIRVTEKPNDKELALSSTIQVFADGDSTRPALLIPIRCRTRSQIGYIPRSLEFPQFEAEPTNSGKLQRVVAVVVPPNRPANDAQITVLVPWARVATRESKGSVMQLTVEFDRRMMPREFYRAVLSASLPDQPNSQELFATGRM